MTLNGNSVKWYALAHGEKVVLSLVGVLTTAMIALAFVGKKSVPSNQSPDELIKRAMDAKLKLGSPVLCGIPPSCGPKSNGKIDPTLLDNIVLLADRLIPQRVRREPNYLPADDVHVVFIRGHMGVKGTRQAAMFRCAIITGLVPLRDQRAEYDAAFVDTLVPDAYDGGQDRPEYYRAILERAEVKPGMADDQLRWIAVNEADNDQTTDDVRDPHLKAEMDKWAGVIQPDLVDASLVERWLVYPNVRPMEEAARAAAPHTEGGETEIDQWLPPMLLKNWTAEQVVHPLIIAAQRRAAAVRNANAAKAAKEEVVEDTERIKRFAAAFEYRLLRCFDFSIEPGKSYRYRVVLVLRNPNRGFEHRYLASPNLRAGKYRTAPPSKPSEVVSVPSDVQVLAGAGVAPTTRQRERGVKLLLSVLADTQEAVALAKKCANEFQGSSWEKKRLQQEAQEIAATWVNVDKIWAAMELSATRGMYFDQEGAAVVRHPIGGANERLKVIDFATGFLLVDFTGGPKKTATKSATPKVEPVQALLLGPDGSLVVRHEAEDRVAYEQSLPKAATPATDAKKPAE